jgi:hypothetical protein
VDIPPAWAWALVVAGVTGVLALIGLRWPGSPLARFIPPVTHLLGGGLIGFISLAFYPALPLVSAIAGMLIVRAVRASRWTDAALLAAGFGAAWTALIGYRLVNDALDPAVSTTWDLTPWLVAGATVLMVGLVSLLALSAWPDRFSRRR